MEIRQIRTLLLLFISVITPYVYADSYINIASFNIAEFGEGNHPETRDLDAIAKLLHDAHLDLIALEEVGVGEMGETQVKKLTSKLNSISDGNQPSYFYYITSKTGDERYAVIYRSPVVLGDDILWLDIDRDPANPGEGGATYYRIPVAIPFSADNFDFYVVIVHLSWGNLERRSAEDAALKEFLSRLDESEDDWIVLGDMNRYGKYSKGSKNKAFDKLLKGNWRKRYRFPLLEAITDPDDMKVYRASDDKYSTTIAKSTDIYDQIIITAGAFHEFGAENPEFGKDVGIIPFDQDASFSGLDHNSIKYKISDHRPIWLRMRIDLEDDD